MGKKSILLKLDEGTHAEWSISAENAKMTLSAWIRERCNEKQVFSNTAGIGLPVAPFIPVREIAVHADEKDPSILVRSSISSPVSLEAVVSETKVRGKGGEITIDEMVAQRNPGHAVGCGCMVCTQCHRFIKQQREAERKNA